MPSPIIVSGLATGSSMAADSRPRTQCGTFTGGVRTFSSPAFFISAAAHSIARSSESRSAQAIGDSVAKILQSCEAFASSERGGN